VFSVAVVTFTLKSIISSTRIGATGSEAANCTRFDCSKICKTPIRSFFGMSHSESFVARWPAVIVTGIIDLTLVAVVGSENAAESRPQESFENAYFKSPGVAPKQSSAMTEAEIIDMLGDGEQGRHRFAIVAKLSVPLRATARLTGPICPAKFIYCTLDGATLVRRTNYTYSFNS
jgi:hypothetical protein